ncbi:hypothetical protein GCM10025868_32200 [Angustibacter aerolatus]|uniref:Glycosyl transferase family 1 domain-containing protein n=1 Tax=Angustibacter aerolatus TaxID=1162965 RepID=A0ABQ6JMH7_9ACTN|nr:hypothetical protein GCM10025868_32200 [Angustibacter aerolatus]
MRWLGSRSDVAGVLSATDVLVSASRDETFGMAVVEGLVAGLPAAYVECPALEEPAGPGRRRRPGARAWTTTTSRSRRWGGCWRSLADEAVARGLQRLPVDPALRSRYGAQPAADRVDAVYRSLTGG